MSFLKALRHLDSPSYCLSMMPVPICCHIEWFVGCLLTAAVRPEPQHICPWRSKWQSHRIGPDSRVLFPHLQLSHPDESMLSITYMQAETCIISRSFSCLDGQQKFPCSVLNITLTLCPSGLRRCGTQPPSSTPTWLLRWDCLPDRYLFRV